LKIERPSKHLYIFDKEVMPTISGNTIVVGKVTIEVDVYDESGIERVEFYIDDVLKFTDYDEPYSWVWNEFAIGKYGIRVIAYDNAGKKTEDKINVIIFNI